MAGQHVLKECFLKASKIESENNFKLPSKNFWPSTFFTSSAWAHIHTNARRQAGWHAHTCVLFVFPKMKNTHTRSPDRLPASKWPYNLSRQLGAIARPLNLKRPFHFHHLTYPHLPQQKKVVIHQVSVSTLGILHHVFGVGGRIRGFPFSKWKMFIKLSAGFLSI